MTIKRNQTFKFSDDIHNITYKVISIRKAERIRTPIRSYKNSDSSIRAVYYVELTDSGKERRIVSNIILESFEDMMDNGRIILQ